MGPGKLLFFSTVVTSFLSSSSLSSLLQYLKTRPNTKKRMTEETMLMNFLNSYLILFLSEF